MSLIVFPYTRKDPSDSIEEMLDTVFEPHNQMAGPESWRRRVYASPAFQKLEVIQLKRLAKEDLYAEEEDLIELKGEVERILSKIGPLSQELNLVPQQLSFRLENILAAIQVALSVPNGGVYIG